MNGLPEVPETEEMKYVHKRIIEAIALLDEFPDEAKARVNDAHWYLNWYIANCEYGIIATMARWINYGWAVVEEVLEETVDDEEEQ